MHDDPAGSRVAWDETKCIGCRMCTLSCPFGAVVYETQKRRIVKCDLCDGAPECVTFCPTSAIEFVEETDAARARQEGRRRGVQKNVRGGEVTCTDG